jgi:hypothetical protein
VSDGKLLVPLARISEETGEEVLGITLAEPDRMSRIYIHVSICIVACYSISKIIFISLTLWLGRSPGLNATSHPRLARREEWPS